MDHWGDPWADNAHDAEPRKNEVAAPLPPTQPAGPVVLNGFLDDAGWGNDDEGFGDWASSENDVFTQDAGTRVPESSSFEDKQDERDPASWNIEDSSDLPSFHDRADWSEEGQDASNSLENPTSETSDSSTTVQLDDRPAPLATNPTGQLQPDDDSSARASTSPSETSHNEAPAESPRTSIDEDRRGEQQSTVDLDEGKGQDEKEEEKPSEKSEEVLGPKQPESRSPPDVDTPSKGILWTDGSMDEDKPAELTEFEVISDSSGAEGARDESRISPTIDTAPVLTSDVFAVDHDLLNQLSPAPKQVEKLDEAPEDPIYSTTARKAWYRLTRKQTLREYNMGTSDDNYIRITWTNSQTRSEVNKTVGRWAREDRISGTGPGARASFYWDTPAPVEPKSTSHARTQSSIPTQRAPAPVRQSLPPLTTNAPAAFSWSSPAVSVDPWKQDNPSLNSIVSPIGSTHATIERVQTPQDRIVSPNLTLHEFDPVTQKRPVPSTSETPAASNSISAPPSQPPVTSLDPWAGLDTLEIDTSSKESAPPEVDDDDDWGDMVSSPTVSTPVATETASQVTTRNNTLSTPASTPQSVRASPAQDPSADAMFASPIVRLRSTISPTSAIFGPKSFVPLNVDQGPIGPGLLKPGKRVISLSEGIKNNLVPAPAVKPADIVLNERSQRPQDNSSAQVAQRDLSFPPEPVPDVTKDDEFSAFTEAIPEPTKSSTPLSAAPLNTAIDSRADAGFSEFLQAVPESPRPITPPSAAPVNTTTDSWADTGFSTFTQAVSEPPRPSTPPNAAPVTTTTDSWADADFSLFESAAPPPAQPQRKSKPDPSDSFSVFNTTPPRSVSVASSAKPFSRSPPRNITPPPLQPLSGATTSAQRRKGEEDQIIAEILGGLPNLGYMLR